MKVKFLASVIIYCFLFTSTIVPQSSEIKFPTKRTENPQSWRQGGLDFVARAKKTGMKTGKAKNVILFVGDGMGISTLTAARWH